LAILWAYLLRALHFYSRFSVHQNKRYLALFTQSSPGIHYDKNNQIEKKYGGINMFCSSKAIAENEFTAF
jgi:hypothetical protein